MWRKLLAKVHPDSNGDHELFIWAMHVRDEVCNGRSSTPLLTEPPPRHSSSSSADAVPFDPTLDFEVVTRAALALADEVPEPYASVLLLVKDCRFAHLGPEYDQQYKGATYKQLAAIGHRVGMDKSQRVRWYRIAESIPLSRRHAGHILGRVKAERAA